LKENNLNGKHTAWLTEEEEPRFLDTLDLEDPHDLLICAFWLMGIFTRFIGGEYFNIKRKDVNWYYGEEGRFIKVRQTVTKNDQ